MKLACPNCGSNIKFIPEKCQVFCEHCNQYKDISDIKLNVNNFRIDEGSLEQTCSSCGAKFNTVDNEIIKICNFCGSENISKTSIPVDVTYKKIIPFKISKAEMINIFINRLKNAPFSNTEFFNEKNITLISGLYIPIIVGEYKMTVESTGILNSYTETKNSDGTTSYSHYTNDYKFTCNCHATIPIDTLKNMQDNIVNNLFPFNLQEAKDFSPFYLAGFSTFKGDDFYYSKLKSSQNLLLDKLYTNIKSFYQLKLGNKIIKRMIPEKNNICLDEISSNRYLIPIWLCSYQHNNYTYTFAVNGQTGKVVSYFPKDNKKIFKAKLKNFVRAFLISFFIAFICGSLNYFPTERVDTNLKIAIIIAFVLFVMSFSIISFFDHKYMKHALIDVIENYSGHIKLSEFNDVVTDYAKSTINKIDKTKTEINVNGEKL